MTLQRKSILVLVSALMIAAALGMMAVSAYASSHGRNDRIGRSPNEPNLFAYLGVQRQFCPSATVTAGFYDWRTESKYRSKAGLHLGYDVAMPAGSPVVAGWPGQVTEVHQWLGSEYGVTVVSPSGFETTYGHISPKVKSGDVLNAGDVVGSVVNDHVDIKMRGPDGMYYDFGHSTPNVAWGGPMTRDDLLRAYATSYYSSELTREEQSAMLASEASAHAAVLAQEKSYAESRTKVPQLKQYFDQGLVARIDVEKAERQMVEEHDKLAQMKLMYRSMHSSLRSQQSRLDTTMSAMNASRAQLHTMGLSDAQILASMHHLAPPDDSLQALRAQTRAQQKSEHAQRQAELKKLKAEVDKYDQLYEQGAVSRIERDKVRQRYETLRGDHQATAAR
jgi:hypothetical protein